LLHSLALNAKSRAKGVGSKKDSFGCPFLLPRRFILQYRRNLAKSACKMALSTRPG